MRRQTLGLLFVGWLLGLLTAFVWPAIATERQTVVVRFSAPSSTNPNSAGWVMALTNDGWVVTRIDTMYETPVVQLERPRYLGLIERAQGLWWDLTASLGGTPPPRPTPVPPKPTTAPAASPRTP
jgi:hypothetical protein